jgi:hypothetical protein
MSGSLASAKAKRAGINPPPPNVPSRAPAPPQPSSPQAGVRLSVPQVLAMFDSRLNKLEAAAKAPVSTTTDRSGLDDMESKFMMLAEEITTMKDVIMKLQAFTMDVNKTLFEERIQIMSDMNDNGIKTQSVEDVDALQIEKISDSAEM